MTRRLFSKASFVRSAFASADLLFDRPTIAFIGRSNVGKSTLINRLCRNGSLMKTSKTPGQTRAVNYLLVDDSFYLCDAPGYGFATLQREHFEPVMKRFLYGNPSLKKVYILVDSRRCMLPADQDFADELLYRKLPFAIVFTKTDKLNMSERFHLNQSKGEVGGELFESGNVSEESLDVLRKDIYESLKQ